MAIVRPNEEHQTGARRTSLIPKPRNEPGLNDQRMSVIEKRDDHEIDMSRFDIEHTYYI